MVLFEMCDFDGTIFACVIVAVWVGHAQMWMPEEDRGYPTVSHSTLFSRDRVSH